MRQQSPLHDARLHLGLLAVILILLFQGPVGFETLDQIGALALEVVDDARSYASSALSDPPPPPRRSFRFERERAH